VSRLGISNEHQYHPRHVLASAALRQPDALMKRNHAAHLITVSSRPSWTHDLKAVAVCQKQTKTVHEKPATSRLFNCPKSS